MVYNVIIEIGMRIRQGHGVREKKRNSLAFGESVFELILNLAGRYTEVSLEKYVVHILW